MILVYRQGTADSEQVNGQEKEKSLEEQHLRTQSRFTAYRTKPPLNQQHKNMELGALLVQYANDSSEHGQQSTSMPCGEEEVPDKARSDLRF